MSEELKACPNPWCEALERDGDYRPQVQYSNFGLCYVACSSCTMHGPTCQHEFEAIAAWNTRADPALAAAQAEVARLRALVKQATDGLIYAPDPACSCHLHPPCLDCVDYGEAREWLEEARAALVQP